MGQVFKAEHASMGRIVAVKVLPRDKSTPEAIANFTREIRALAKLDHPNLVRGARRRPRRQRLLPGHRVRARHDLRKLVRRDGPLEHGRRGVDHLAGGRRAGARPRRRAGPPRREAGQRAGHARRARPSSPTWGWPARSDGDARDGSALRQDRRHGRLPLARSHHAPRGTRRRPGTSTRWAARSTTR